MLKNLSIHNKLLISYSTLLSVMLLLVSLFVYRFVQSTITANIESELDNSAQSILDMVKTSVDVSIKNHLRGVAEKNREIVSFYYAQYKADMISEAEAKNRAAQVLLCQTIGTSGYIYCVDSAGTVVVHPDKNLIHVNVAQNAFVRNQMKLKEGYVEYDWKNIGETASRPKALYMTWFAPWDWIISVSSYRTEFNELIDVKDFKASVLNHRFGKTGYAFVIDKAGQAIIHPKLEGVNILNTADLPNTYFNEMLTRKKGKIIYPWKNPDEAHAREKLVIFDSIPEFEWTVGCSSYLNEFYEPLGTIRKVFLICVIVSILLVLPLTFKISTAITNPLKKLMQYFDQADSRDFSLRMEVTSNDEVGQLVGYFNSYMAQLEHYNKDIIRYKTLTKQLMDIADSARQRIGQDLHDDLCPHLIGVQGLSAVLEANLKEEQSNHASLAGNIVDLMDQSIEKSRILARGACPVHLEKHGLPAALEDMTIKFSESSGISIYYTVDERISLSGSIEATHLYYITQEAIVNAIKHSQAAKIVVKLRAKTDGVHLTISDNGTGFIQNDAVHGIGLEIMRYRAKMIGAFLEIDSITGDGTRIYVVFNR